MSEVKDAMEIVKNKLANADKRNASFQGFSIAEMEAIWGVLAKAETDAAALQQKLDAAEAKIRQLEWDSVFIPKDIEAALAVMGVALPESKEEFNFSINRWIQRLVDRVIRVGPELDAERNSLRAEGVEKAIEHLHNKFGSTGHVGIPIISLQWLADQLRSGEPK